MATGTETKRRAERRYVHPGTMAGCSLRYFVGAAGDHVVAWQVACEEWPLVYRHATVEEARRTWARVKRLIRADGFLPRGAVGRYADVRHETDAGARTCRVLAETAQQFTVAADWAAGGKLRFWKPAIGKVRAGGWCRSCEVRPYAARLLPAGVVPADLELVH